MTQSRNLFIIIIYLFGKSTIDQICSLRQILEKTHEKQVDTHRLFVDYKDAFDSPTRDRGFAVLGIPANLIYADWRWAIPAAPSR